MNEQPTNEVPSSQLKWWQRGLALLPGVEIVSEAESADKPQVSVSPTNPPLVQTLPHSREIGVGVQGVAHVDAAQVAEISEQRSSAVFAIDVLAQINVGIEAQELALSHVLQLKPTELRRAAIASYLAVSHVDSGQVAAWRDEARKAAQKFDADLAGAIS